MNRILILLFLSVLFAMVGCSKKSHPSKETAKETGENMIVKKQKLITTVPKVIIVDDKVAKKSIDGRYYYDLQGHRYWRNNKDGKYYLFHKSMFDDDSFKSPDQHE